MSTVRAARSEPRLVVGIALVVAATLTAFGVQHFDHLRGQGSALACTSRPAAGCTSRVVAVDTARSGGDASRNEYELVVVTGDGTTLSFARLGWDGSAAFAGLRRVLLVSQDGRPVAVVGRDGTVLAVGLSHSKWFLAATLAAAAVAVLGLCLGVWGLARLNGPGGPLATASQAV